MRRSRMTARTTAPRQDVLCCTPAPDAARVETALNAGALTVGLAGNPNVGKSTIFNGLTGTRQHVGNWPGKTVEKKEGVVSIDGQEVIVVDLPGTYSLSAYSIEEVISRDFLIDSKPGAVIVVVDASNLERNLFLVLQILELGLPVIIALNMMDIARSNGIHIEPQTLSALLGNIPIIETVGNQRIGLEAIRSALAQITPQASAGAHRRALLLESFEMIYSPEIEQAITRLESHITADPDLRALYRARWLAVKLLENDSVIQQRLETMGKQTLLETAAAQRTAIEAETGEDPETLITDDRYMVITHLVSRAISRHATIQETMTDRIDRVVTHRLFGIPIFLGLMWLVFQLTANVSAPLVDWFDSLIHGPLASWITALIQMVNLDGTWVESLLLDGVLAGVGGVLVFIPVLMMLYIVIGILEDSGYMARAAFVMDRAMRLLGLHGKSFLPMLVGFGCTVPAVYATRTLENEDERKLTGSLLTFMSCGARLPVYVVFATAFFGANSGSAIFSMYLLGIGVALFTGFVLKRTVYRSKPPQPFVMELPPYRMPRGRDVFLQTWERTSSFVRKAAVIITATSVCIWLLLAVPVRGSGTFNQVEAEDSLFGWVSSAAAPIFAPAGFGDWRAAGSLVTGMVAKEVIVGTMSQAYLGTTDSIEADETVPPLGEQVGDIFTGLGESLLLTGQEIVNIVPRTVNLIPGVDMPELNIQGEAGNQEDTTALQSALRAHFTPLAAIAFMAFVLLYVPCMTTLTAMRHEFGRRWTAQQILYTGGIAWAVATLIYQGGTVLNLAA